MKCLLGTILLVGCLPWASGCAMCCAPFDYDYPSIAGRWVRTNPTDGRVGSVFAPAGMPAEGVPVAAQSGAPAAATSAPAEAAPSDLLPSDTMPRPAAPSRRMPLNAPSAARPIIPRAMGETYLPRTP